MTPAAPCRDNPWTCPICTKRPCRCVSHNANPDWIDHVAVDEAVAGRRIARELTDAEKVIVARRLIDRGETINAVAVRLHLNHMATRRLLEGRTA